MRQLHALHGAVSLFEGLREANILLQETMSGSQENLGKLETALTTRVSQFATVMNDVTTRNGVATQTLEDQLSVFNTKTSKALENLGSLSSEFERHGKELVEAAGAAKGKCFSEQHRCCRHHAVDGELEEARLFAFAQMKLPSKSAPGAAETRSTSR